METTADKYDTNVEDIKDVLAEGLLYTHTRINDATKRALESSSFLYALIELLDEKGLLSIEELDERKNQVAERLVKNFTSSGIGMMYQDPEFDKYSFPNKAHVDCDSCLSACKAMCCKLPFALSRQDVEEGIIRWEFGRPYMIAHDDDGYCVHLDRQTYKCTVHDHRPVPCQGFNCKENEKWRIWSSHEEKRINPEIHETICQSNRNFYNYPKA